MRGVVSIPDERLIIVLRDHFGFDVGRLDALPVGHDARAALYRATTQDGAAYLVKVRTGALYEPSWRIPRYLRDRGACQVVAPLPSVEGRLWIPVERWSVAVYPYIEGDSGWEPGMTDDLWRAAGAALRQVHEISPLALHDPDLRVETFDPGEYIRWARAFEARLLHSEGATETERELRAAWLARREMIAEALESLVRLGAALRRETRPQVICHGDLHPGNMIRDHEGGVFLIDWDDVMLAPRERDFLFTDGNPVTAAERPEASPFFQGYGHTTVDWTVLTYYIWERTVQDFIECAHVVYLQQDIGEETRAAELRLFKMIFSELGNGSLFVARAAARRLSGSTLSRRVADNTRMN